MRYDEPHNANRPQWHQLNIQFDDHQTAERAVITHLGPVLTEVESTGLVISWFFIRKQWWRFRYLPTSGTSAREAKKLLEDTVRALRDVGYASRWVESITSPRPTPSAARQGWQPHTLCSIRTAATSSSTSSCPVTTCSPVHPTARASGGNSRSCSAPP